MYVFTRENWQDSKKSCLALFKDIFGEETECVSCSTTLGPMGQFRIVFLYYPANITITLDIDRGLFSLDLEDSDGDWTTLGKIADFDNEATDSNIQNAAELLFHALHGQDICFYRSKKNRLYKKVNGKYIRVSV